MIVDVLSILGIDVSKHFYEDGLGSLCERITFLILVLFYRESIAYDINPVFWNTH
jgi:hypothetical protein